MRLEIEKAADSGCAGISGFLIEDLYWDMPQKKVRCAGFKLPAEIVLLAVKPSFQKGFQTTV
jgi:hypothetical protein